MRLISCKACGIVYDYDTLKNNMGVSSSSSKKEIYRIDRDDGLYDERFQCGVCYMRNKIEDIYVIEE